MSRTNTLLGLLLAAVLGSITIIPYEISIVRRPEQAEKPAAERISEIVQGVAVAGLISLGLIVLGLRLRKSLGVRISVLRDWPPADLDSRRRVQKAIAAAVAIGIGMDVVLPVASYFVEPTLPKPRVPLATPPAWTGLSASIGAGN